MTRDEALTALKDAQAQTDAAAKLYQRATEKAADVAAREKQIADWAESRRAAGKIVRASELTELAHELEAADVAKRRTEAAGLRVHRERLLEAIQTAERSHQELEPTWVPLMRHQQGGDYAIAMLRQADEHALTRVEAQLADWTQTEIWTAYQRALETHDDVMLRAIEAKGWRRSATGKPTDADSASLFNLLRAIDAARASRHPAEATAAREFLKTLPGGESQRPTTDYRLTLVSSSAQHVA
jgi:hypothetical protein